MDNYQALGYLKIALKKSLEQKKISKKAASTIMCEMYYAFDRYTEEEAGQKYAEVDF